MFFTDSLQTYWNHQLFHEFQNQWMDESINLLIYLDVLRSDWWWWDYDNWQWHYKTNKMKTRARTRKQEHEANAGPLWPPPRRDTHLPEFMAGTARQNMHPGGLGLRSTPVRTTNMQCFAKENQWSEMPNDARQLPVIHAPQGFGA